jgi:RES domain
VVSELNLSNVTLADIQHHVFRNIVSIRASQDLFDDLSDDPQEWALAQQVEDDVKPPPYQSATPIIDRPFEDALWFNAIDWPFKHWQASRFCNGSFGLWYGCSTVQTSVYETVHHWLNGLLKDAGFDQEGVVGERKIYSVSCQGALLDFRALHERFAGLSHPSDYSQAQVMGARLHHEGHPGLITPSVRHPQGENYVIFNPKVLARPQLKAHLTYRVHEGHVRVEKQTGVKWMGIAR